MLWTLFAWSLTALSVAGTFLVVRKKSLGFVFWIITNIGWVYVDLASGVPSQAALFSVYLGLSVYGVWEWKRK